VETAAVLRIAGTAALATAAAYGLHRLADRMERRGWIHYRRGRGGGISNAVGNAMQELHAVVEPQRARVVEMREELRQDLTGAPPSGKDAERSGR
jgi:hypothetical protein